MKITKDKCKIAVVQASPVMFDKAGCTTKAVKLISESSQKGAELVVFPELFIPCYPYGLTFGFTVGSRSEPGRKDWKLYYDNSVYIPGPETDQLCEAAKACQCYVSIGLSERVENNCTLYNTNIIISPLGEILTIHRKLKPTGSERVVYGDADCHFFPVAPSPWGNIGSLICWESYMPLARVALYSKGITIYISPNTNDNEEWQATIRHIAIEGHCFFVNCDMFFKSEMYPNELEAKDELKKLPETVCRGGSCIVDPYGHYVTQPVWDKEEIIVAELDMQMVPASRMEFDVCGHYSRPDVLKLQINDI